MNVALSLKGVSGGYGDLRVVRHVDLEVHHGAITALLGRNGAGKTTTLRIVAGLNRARTGEILLDGVDITKMKPHERVVAGVAFVQEGKRIFRNLTVRDNMLLGAYTLPLKGRERQRAIDENLDRFPILAEHRTRRASVLSGGQQQILAIAQALMSRPKVLLLDEPSGGLAPAIVGDLLNIVKDLSREGLAVVLVEQAVDFALSVADAVSVLNVGETTYQGSTSAAGLRAVIDEAYLGSRQLGAAAPAT